MRRIYPDWRKVASLSEKPKQAARGHAHYFCLIWPVSQVKSQRYCCMIFLNNIEMSKGPLVEVWNLEMKDLILKPLKEENSGPGSNKLLTQLPPNLLPRHEI